MVSTYNWADIAQPAYNQHTALSSMVAAGSVYRSG